MICPRCKDAIGLIHQCRRIEHKVRLADIETPEQIAIRYLMMLDAGYDVSIATVKLSKAYLELTREGNSKLGENNGLRPQSWHVSILQTQKY